MQVARSEAVMSDRFARFAPLITGVLFVAFAVKGTQMTANTPSSTASGATVLAYYKAHNARMGGAGFSLMLCVVAGLLVSSANGVPKPLLAPIRDATGISHRPHL